MQILGKKRTFVLMYEIMDADLGRIVVKPHLRAKRVIVRRKQHYFQLTSPAHASKKSILEAIERLKLQLLKKLPEKRFIDNKSTIKTLTFDTLIVRSKMQHVFKINLKAGLLKVFVPHGTDFYNSEVQEILKKLIVEVLRFEAKRILSPKVARFSEQTGLKYNQVKINKSQSRWGSCSSKKNINLSLFLLFLPEELIDYVILHELTHTVEMNHSERFWTLLNRFCNGKSNTYRKALKAFQSEGYSYFRE